MKTAILILLVIGVIIEILTLAFVGVQDTETFKVIDRRIAEKLERKTK